MGCAARADSKAFSKLLRSPHRGNGVVCAKRPFAGPERVLSYLGRYPSTLWPVAHLAATAMITTTVNT